MKLKLIKGTHLTVGDKKDIKTLLNNATSLDPDKYYKTSKKAKKQYNIQVIKDNVIHVTIYQKQNNPWGCDYHNFEIALTD